MIRKGRQDVQQNGIKRNKGRLKKKRLIIIYLFIRFPNESKTSNVIIHSYTEKICIKMDPMIRFSSTCVRNNTQYTAQQNYAQFYIPPDG